MHGVVEFFGHWTEGYSPDVRPKHFRFFTAFLVVERLSLRYPYWANQLAYPYPTFDWMMDTPRGVFAVSGAHWYLWLI